MAEPLMKRICQGDCRLNGEQIKHVGPDEIRKAILHDLTKPLVFQSYLSSRRCDDPSVPLWKCMGWDIKDWGKLFVEKVLKFRIGHRVKEKMLLSAPQWETTCLRANMTYSEFLEWSQGQRTCLTSCGQEIDSNDHWAYFDYFYLRNMEIVDQMKDAVDWGIFGFPDRGPQDSTLWIGTTGANTPCHIDTYGCNLVAQISGRKRWVLFPKSQSQFLSPTRIPYEESSIYSEVGFPHPSINSHPKLCSSTPYVVTLEPGDVLFVPKQWWHFVENLDFAVSINTWIELPSDREERIKEALVMYQVGSLCQGVQSLDIISSVFNPNMMDVASMVSHELLNLLVHRVFLASCPKDNSTTETDDKDTSLGGISSRKVEITKQFLPSKNKNAILEPEPVDGNWGSEQWCVNHNIAKVPNMSFLEYMNMVLGFQDGKDWMKGDMFVDKEEHSVSNKNSNEDDAVTQFSQIKLLIDTFTDQRVIEILKMVLDEKLAKN
ncbi:HSPB1-associated protein 1 [Panulirus ornatus]|uniref:HSPB1-associated protein 1 n=1 Tax=Panulirus ornatus TaxID=150431 RepID=UPI003A8B28B0